MIPRLVRTCWWLALVLAPLGAGMLLGASSSRLEQRAVVLLILYSVAVAIVWLRVRLALQPPTLRTLQVAFQS